MPKARIQAFVNGHLNVMKKNNIPSPAINGTLEISHKNNGIFIGGTPEALKSLAKTLIWLAEFDQDIEDMPNGERKHIHLHIKDGEYGALTKFSKETEICRLDAKGTKELPNYYKKS
jgi:hypothetical protein